uniref:Uncharacterized protein n=1 Tax=Anopheles farauti TaxID=69004 RepID=A0A182QMH0_9DIPT
MNKTGKVDAGNHSLLTEESLKVSDLQKNSGDGSVQEVDVEVGVITRRVGADLLERLQDVLRSRDILRQMGTLWLESVLVGDVRHLVLGTVIAGVREATRGRLASDTVLLGRDTIARFVAVVVRTVRVDDRILRKHLSLSVLRVLGGRDSNQSGNDELESVTSEE